MRWPCSRCTSSSSHSIGGEVGLPSGCDVPVHRSDHRDRLLVRYRGRHARQRMPVGRTGRTCRAAAPGVQAQRRRQRDILRTTRRRRRCPKHRRGRRHARATRSEAPARWSSCTDSCPIGVASTGRCESTRLVAALHLGFGRLPGLELAAACLPTCHCGPSRRADEPQSVACGHVTGRTHPAGAVGTAPRPPRRGASGPVTVIELAEEYGYKDLPTTDVDDLATWFNRERKAQRPRALPRDVRPHGRRDAGP